MNSFAFRKMYLASYHPGTWEQHLIDKCFARAPAAFIRKYELLLSSFVSGVSYQGISFIFLGGRGSTGF
jgi:hypothetical protein